MLDDLDKVIKEADQPRAKRQKQHHHASLHLGRAQNFRQLVVEHPHTRPSVTRMPKMKHRPPMVGVPFFLLCQVGPSSRTVWPKCSRCSAGS